MGVSGAVAATTGLMRQLGIWGGLAGLFAGKPAPTGGRGGPWNTELQMQQSPHLAGFVGFDWWAGAV